MGHKGLRWFLSLGHKGLRWFVSLGHSRFVSLGIKGLKVVCYMYMYGISVVNPLWMNLSTDTIENL